MAHITRNKKFLGTSVQKKLLLLIFSCAVIPLSIAVLSLYYLVFSLLAWQIGIPEEMADTLMPVIRKINIIMFIAIPVVLFVLWVIALEISHRIAGPICRLEKELDERLAGRAHGPIKLRLKDELKILVEKINKLICK